jgi:hypothetical protein
VAAMAEMTAAAAGSSPRGAWSAALSTPNLPAISYDLVRRAAPPVVKASAPLVIVECKDTQMLVQVRGLTPLQAFPQPELKIGTARVQRAKHPDVIMFGDDKAALEITFPIKTSILNAIGAAQPLHIRFDTQHEKFPAVPPAMAKKFTDACRASLPLPMLQD